SSEWKSDCSKCLLAKVVHPHHTRRRLAGRWVSKIPTGFVHSFPDLIKSAGQPAWLQPWFNFWYNATVGNAAPFVYGIALLEVSLGVALVLGLVRKLAYIGGLILSLLIWAIPEGFGGPYGPGSTD